MFFSRHIEYDILPGVFFKVVASLSSKELVASIENMLNISVSAREAGVFEPGEAVHEARDDTGVVRGLALHEVKLARVYYRFLGITYKIRSFYIEDPTEESKN